MINRGAVTIIRHRDQRTSLTLQAGRVAAMLAISMASADPAAGMPFIQQPDWPRR